MNIEISWRTWERIANRITGISFPVFGVSWNPLPLERTAAERAITYLESKGLLYTEFQWENPDQCYADAFALREELTQHILELTRRQSQGADEPHVYLQMDAMRDARRVFRIRIREQNLATVSHYATLSDKQRADFLQALGALRDGCGKQIVILAVAYGIDVADHLKALLAPSEDDRE